MTAIDAKFIEDIDYYVVQPWLSDSATVIRLGWVPF